MKSIHSKAFLKVYLYQNNQSYSKSKLGLNSKKVEFELHKIHFRLWMTVHILLFCIYSQTSGTQV